jgi:hypothetical protein
MIDEIDETPFRFAWQVDQDGYSIESVESDGLGRPYEVIRPKGGPYRFYRPLDDDGLWLRFGEHCRSREDVLSFATEFGPLIQPPQRIDEILETATLIRQIADRLVKGDRGAAALLFDQHGIPSFKAAIIRDDTRVTFEFVLIPLTLRDALLLQAGEAINRQRRFRRCRNERCSNWFRLGPGAKTERRQFCSDRCRVASARRSKKGA